MLSICTLIFACVDWGIGGNDCEVGRTDGKELLERIEGEVVAVEAVGITSKKKTERLSK